MNYLDRSPRTPTDVTFARGVGTLGEITEAAFDSISYADNANAAYVALERAYGDRIEAIRQATGVQLDNPLVAADEERRRLATERPESPLRPRDPQRDPRAIYERKQAEFTQRLADLERQKPDQAGVIRASVPMVEDAKALTRDADQRLQRLMDSRDGAGKWGAMFLGAGAAMFRDPIQVSALVLGGGPGAARTIAGRIATVAAKEAALSGLTEAAIQPSVQSWRREAGLDAGFDEALRNVLLATAFGGVVGAGFQGIGEGVRRYVGRQAIDDAADLAIEKTPSETGRGLLSGDVALARARLPAVRETLAPEARGALDALDRVEAIDQSRPTAATPAHHDRATIAADRAVARGDYEFTIEPDPDQVRRIVDQLVGQPAPEAPAERSITDFLIERGGLQEFRGELAAIGANRVSQRFRGRLVQEGGLPLDRAREIAAEAGFLDARYGSAERAMQESTVADLLDVLEADIRQPANAARASDDGERAYVERLVTEIAGHAGPAIDDELIIRAANLADQRGLDPLEALDQVLIAADRAADAEGPRVNAGQRSGDVLPGWSDEELEALAESRPATLDEPSGLDDPAQVLPDDEISDAELAALEDDLLLPLGDEELMDVATVRDTLDRMAALRAVVEACRI